VFGWEEVVAWLSAVWLVHEVFLHFEILQSHQARRRPSRQSLADRKLNDAAMLAFPEPRMDYQRIDPGGG
jgi:hypothetical protein